MNLLSIGEILWDVFPDQEFLGGAALNFCVNLHRLGNNSALLTAVGKDERGKRTLEAVAKTGLTTSFIQETSEAATGVARVEIDPSGEPKFTIERPAAYDRIELTDEVLNKIQKSNLDWLYFGTLMQTDAAVEAITTKLARLSPDLRCFYDVNLRTGHWNFPLIQRLCSLATIIKMNEGEAQILSQLNGAAAEKFTLEGFCKAWSEQYKIGTICITRGKDGCFLYANGECVEAVGQPVSGHDTVGAGDAFSAGFLHGYAQGWPLQQIAQFANSLGSLVASLPGATPAWSLKECYEKAGIPMPKESSK